jgi:hypothetical protein
MNWNRGEGLDSLIGDFLILFSRELYAGFADMEIERFNVYMRVTCDMKKLGVTEKRECICLLLLMPFVSRFDLGSL